MSDDWKEEYPEAAPYIQEAIEAHGEDWVMENYFWKISQLGVVMSIPEPVELPFYDAGKHDLPTDAEKREAAAALREQNLRTGTKPGSE